MASIPQNPSSSKAPSAPGSSSSGAVGPAQSNKALLVDGEQRDSVSVQSQLASAVVSKGDITGNSNLGQVITDLDSAHSASRGWIDAENDKISQWGKNEIQQIVDRTRGMEQQLVEGAKAKQRELDDAHSKELQDKVRAMDMQKAAALKELQDSMQQQIQAQLTQSKTDIHRIESELNKKKMDLLQQSQLRSAKEMDQLSNLVVEAQLIPSKTRTVIETNTDTGNVLAVATGGDIATGSAQSERYSSARMAAVPHLGQVQQQSAAVSGNLVEDRTGRKVGAGDAAATRTEVVKQPPHSSHAGQQQQPQAPQANSAVVNPHVTSGPGIHANPQHKPVDAAYGKHLDTAGASDKDRLARASEPKSTDAAKRV